MTFPATDSLALCFMFAVSLGAALTPVVYASNYGYNESFRIADMFAAGVLLSTGLTHMLPEASKAIDENASFIIANLKYDYSLSGLLTVVGVCIMHLVHAMPTKGEDSASAKGAMIFVTALTVHCILEGLALGANIGNGAFSTIFTAIMLHKGFAGLSLGSLLARADLSSLSKKTSCVIFAFASPVAAIMAYVLVQDILDGEASQFATGVLNAISAGVFIYMALVDMLLNHDDHGHGHDHDHGCNESDEKPQSYGTLDLEESGFIGLIDENEPDSLYDEYAEIRRRLLSFLRSFRMLIFNILNKLNNDTAHALIFVFATAAMSIISALTEPEKV